MHRQKSTRSSLTTLASLLLVAASAGLTSASTPSPPVNHPECLHSRGRELAAAASCGDDGSINYCFSQIPLDAAPERLVTDVEECFLNAGCSVAEAPVEAFWALRRCEKPPSPADLRRRQGNGNKYHENAAAMPIPRDAGITLAARQASDAPKPAAATTTEGSPSPCYTPSEIEITSCPVQSTGPDAGKTLRKGCVPTTTTTPVCAKGLICRSETSCMRKQGVGTAGTIIAIFFAGAIAVSVFGVCFMCCREKREQRRLVRAAEAAAIAREAKNNAMLAAKKPAPSVMGSVSSSTLRDGGMEEVGQPLMHSVGGDHHQPPLPPMPQQYGGAASMQDGGNNPFADSHPLR